MNSENAFLEYETDEEDSFPEITELSIVSGGCHLYGYMLSPDKMLKPLAKCLNEAGGKLDYETINSNHSFVGQRMKLAHIVGRWLEEHL